MNISDYANELLTAGAGVAASIIAWKQGIKTAKSTHLENVDKAIKIWENTAEKLEAKLNVVDAEMVTLRKNHKDCEESKKQLEIKVKCLDDKMCELEEQNKVMKEALHNVIGTPKNIRK